MLGIGIEFLPVEGTFQKRAVTEVGPEAFPVGFDMKDPFAPWAHQGKCAFVQADLVSVQSEFAMSVDDQKQVPVMGESLPGVDFPWIG